MTSHNTALLVPPTRPESPATTRSTRKIAPALSGLRDVNRCSVRPGDLVTHQGFAVLVTDTQGRIGGDKQGYFLHQTRFLSRFDVAIDGDAPHFVSANTVDHHSIVAYHLAPSPAGAEAGAKRERPDASPGEIVQKAIELQTNAFVGGGLHIDLIVTNHAMADTAVSLAILVEADFADLNEALADKRQQTGAVERRWTARDVGDEAGGALDLRYTHPDLDLGCAIRVSGGDRWIDSGDRLVCQLALVCRQTRLISLDIIPRLDGADHEPLFGVDGVFSKDAVPAVARRGWAEECATLEASDSAVQNAWDQAVSDLASLQIGEGPDRQPCMIVAGMPNYSGLFGRDAYLTALQSAMLNPSTLRGALQVLTPFNADSTDDFRDAEPGKVLHQRQQGPLARLGISPFLAYYGDHSTPGLFFLAAAKDFAHSGDRAFLLSLKDKLCGTLDWMERNADQFGFYPYQTRSPKGVKNQSWKDSGEAVLYPDGTDVADPIAMADIQALYYAGQQSLGLAFAECGEHALAARLLKRAGDLKHRFNERFWMPEERFFAIALDPDKRQVRSIASDPGTCLAYGIVDEDKAEAVADRLLGPDMFSGWGIRTLSSQHPAYNPFAYHLGTVWPSPNAVAAYGLARYGFHDHLHRVARGLFDAAQVFTLDRLPEVFGGHARDSRHPHPGLYPGACSPQAWSAGAVILLIESMLGLIPLASRDTLLVDPVLPEWLPEITLQDLAVGLHRVSLRFRRDATGRTEFEVVEGAGVSIVRPPPLPPGRDRVAAAIAAVASKDRKAV